MAKTKIETSLINSFKYEDTRCLIDQVLKDLKEQGRYNATCIPFLRDMGDHYDTYLDAKEFFKTNSRVTINKKGEEVKHPMVNIGKEAYAQYLVIAKEFGFTSKSAAQLNSHPASNKGEDDNSPITKWK